MKVIAKSVKAGGDSIEMDVSGNALKFKGDPETGHATVTFERAMVVAAMEVNRARVTFRMSDVAGETIGDRWDSHPDKSSIQEWLEARGVPDDFYVLYFISAHVISEWHAIPKRTSSEHKKLYGNIQRTALALKALLKDTGEPYYRGGGYGLEHAVICDLFTDREADDILATVEAWNDAHPEEMEDGTEVIQPAKTMFPTIEEILDRVSAAALRIELQGPIHSQPNKRGALNGYFIRRMDSLIRQRYGDAPIEVLSAIATIALNEVIDDDLTRKSVNLSERSKAK